MAIMGMNVRAGMNVRSGSENIGMNVRVESENVQGSSERVVQRAADVV